MAIAQELTGLKEHLNSLANTSINGQYLFSGSSFSQKPVDSNGNYLGNDDRVKALINAGVQLPFNIDGASLFLGADNDYARTVSTNVPKKNITLLHDQPSVDRYVTVDDKVRDMTGNGGDGVKSYFYVTGAQSDGTSFKQRIEISPDSKISDLLAKIKDAYKGNVDVTLNNYGQIEVKDLQKGSSKLQFSMVASDNSVALTKATAGMTAGSTVITLNSTAGIAIGDKLYLEGIGQLDVTAVGVPAAGQITFTPPLAASAKAMQTELNVRRVNNPPLTDVEQLASSGQSITEFTKSGMAPISISSATAWNDSWDHSAFNFNVEFKNRQTGAVAQPQELMSTIGGIPDRIDLNGNTHVLALGAASTMRDYVDAVQGALDAEFGANNFSAALVDGKMLVKDRNIDPKNSYIESSPLRTMRMYSSTATDVFASVNGVESDRVFFKKDGATLSSNVSQVVKSTNQYAKPTDTLLSASGVSTLVGTTMNMDVTNINGVTQTVTMNFGAAGSTFTVGANTYNIINAASPQVTTPGDQVTYRQFMDVIGMVVGATLPATVTPAAPTLAQAADYNSAVAASSRRANVFIDDSGKITIEDKTSSATKANLSMYDANTNTGFGAAATINTSSVTLNSNNALTVDDPYISLFDQLQMAIEAVQSGKTRAADNGDDPRNTGMQNAITAIDHIFDHVVRKHTDIGAIGSSFQLSKDRSDTLKINVKTVRSEILDTDIGSAYLELNQRTINYQALLSTVGKINGLSLVNYLK
jgi:flagellar hook-associated protein 3 FlgL